MRKYVCSSCWHVSDVDMWECHNCGDICDVLETTVDSQNRLIVTEWECLGSNWKIRATKRHLGGDNL